ncbi:trypsin-like serine protease [Streptomyces macrolidinus]|uniref:trypsin-like serine protease n=1 Tax=Streptomyces macrolidinus TaxID=2952607 RepID=UPI003556B960
MPVLIAGWGRTCNDPSPVCEPPIRLKALSTSVLPPETCNRPPGDFRPDIELCTASATFGSPCQGDSGGPVWNRYLGGPWVLIGAVSRGSAPACGFTDTIATDLTAPPISDWIRGVLQGPGG